MKKSIIAAAFAAFAPLQAQDPSNLFPEGNFEQTPEILAPNPNPATSDPLNAQEGALYVEPGDYKNKGCSVSMENEEGSGFLRFQAPEGFNGILRTYIPLKLPDPAPAAVTISLRWRVTDSKLAANAPEWAGAQCDPIFVMDDGSKKVINGTLRLRGNTDGEWQEVEKSVSVPEGAKMIVLQPGLYLATGTLDVDDVKVFAE